MQEPVKPISICVYLWFNSFMTIHILNCFTCNARIPRHWECGTLDLLIETNDGLAAEHFGLAPAMWFLLAGSVALLVGLPRSMSSGVGDSA